MTQTFFPLTLISIRSKPPEQAGRRGACSRQLLLLPRLYTARHRVDVVLCLRTGASVGYSGRPVKWVCLPEPPQLLSDVELELRQCKEREWRKEGNRVLAGVVVAGAFGLWMIVANWDHIAGFVDGTDPYQGIALPSLLSDIGSVFRFLATSRVIWVILAGVAVLYVLFGMWWRRAHDAWQQNQRS